MAAEREGIPLTAIHISLADRSITLEAQDQTVAKLTFSSGTIYFQPAAVPTEQAQNPPVLPSSPEAKEKDLAALTGRLKTKPKEGRPDGKGHPTAWARLAVHEEGRDDAHMYSATFHRHTAKTALTLPKDAQITVQGYPHLSENPQKRMDTLSVIDILEPRGEGKKRQG